MKGIGIFLLVVIAVACTISCGHSVAEEASAPALVTQLLDRAGMSSGVCVVLGCDSADETLELIRSSKFLLHALDPDPLAVAALQKKLDKNRVPIGRGFAETQAFENLPHANGTVDLVLSFDFDMESVRLLEEIQRVLRPEGKAILGSPHKKLSTRKIKSRLKEEGIENYDVYRDGFGTWIEITKPAPAGMDDWSHWQHGPDNNTVSTDTVIKAPYMTQWLAKPYYITMPAITTAAGGRTFLAMGHIAHHEREEEWLNTLLARNGYNGAELWRMKLPDGYLVHRSAFIATDDTFYMISLDGRGCTMLDPETGERRGEIRIPGMNEEWKWMAMQGDTLYVLLGEQKDPAESISVRSKYSHWSWRELSDGYYGDQVPWGFGSTIVAYSLAKQKVRWEHREDSPIDSRAMCMGDGDIFLYCPDKHISRLDGKTGRVAWANGDAETRKLIEEKGRGLTSTPGFRTSNFSLYTPVGLFFEAQTRMNLVGVSPDDGSLMWHRKKTTNNPNLIYADGNLLAGIGKNGSTLSINPKNGETIEDLGFGKRSCARLTATPDSFFCRGMPEGLTRYDRNEKKILFNGALRPACNDGVLPANGLLYIGPWTCDCNLTLMGAVAMCSAGDFNYETATPRGKQLIKGDGDALHVADFDMSDKDWPVYRGNTAHSASSKAKLGNSSSTLWTFKPGSTFSPTAPTAAGGLVFYCGSDGNVYALDGVTGAPAWRFQTNGPILQPPTIWNGRAYVGSGDGFVYALEAATGRLLWKFRVAPVDRRIMVYGALCSTWPVNSGVLVRDGVAYAAAGIIDYDGTYVCALDAESGKLLWQNSSSAHLDESLRKGVSVQGNLTFADGRLWMASGNVFSPASFDLDKGDFLLNAKYLGAGAGDGSPRTNRGEEMCVLNDEFVLFGGRLMYSAYENVVNPGFFDVAKIIPGQGIEKPVRLCSGKIPPVWNEEGVVLINGRLGKPTGYSMEAIAGRVKGGGSDARRSKAQAPLWTAELPEGSDVVAMAAAADATVVVCALPRQRSMEVPYAAYAINNTDGSLRWRQNLPGPAVPGGLLVDRGGRVVVTLQNGGVAVSGGELAFNVYLNALVDQAKPGGTARQESLSKLNGLLQITHNLRRRPLIIDAMARLGVDAGSRTRKEGYVSTWSMMGPVPRNDQQAMRQIALPTVDVSKSITVGEKKLTWHEYLTESPEGIVNLARFFGANPNTAAFVHTEIDLPAAQDLILHIGSGDGFTCWFNGEKVGGFDRQRRFTPSQTRVAVKGRPGNNTIVMMVSQIAREWAFNLRVTDAQDKPIALAMPGR